MLSLFTVLLSVHIWADFALQFEELYQLKTRYLKGHALHVLIHAFLGLCVLAPILLDPAAWFLVLGINTLHLIQDLIKYRFFKERRVLFASFTIDQIFHAGVLAAASALFAKAFPRQTQDLANAYAAGVLEGVVLLSLWVFLVFGAAYWWHAFRLSHVPSTRPDHGITSAEMWWGLAEKSFFFGAAATGSFGLWLTAVAAAGLLRLTSPRLRNLLDWIFNLGAGLFVGLWARKWVLA